MHDVELLRSFAVLNRTFLSFFSAELAVHDLSYSEGVMVVNIGHRPGTTQQALCAELVLDKGAVARAVKGLKARGLVRVQVAPEDKRAHALTLTASGKKLLRQIDQLNRGWIDAVTVDLTASDRRVLFKVLEHMLPRARAASQTLTER